MNMVDQCQVEWRYQHWWWMGREVWLVWCFPCSCRPQWKKVVLFVEGQTKAQACSTPVKESKCADLLAPSIHLAADGSMDLLHHLSQILQWVKAAIKGKTSVFSHSTGNSIVLCICYGCCEEENSMSSFTTNTSIIDTCCLLSVYVYALKINLKTYIYTPHHTGNKFQEG